MSEFRIEIIEKGMELNEEMFHMLDGANCDDCDDCGFNCGGNYGQC